jgi:putative acyl-CoA dehydrogenase
VSAIPNQPPPFEDVDLFSTDPALCEAAARDASGVEPGEFSRFGTIAGSATTIALGVDANRFEPELRTHDRFGERIDEVAFHPAWHRLMEISIGNGLHGAAWNDPSPHAHTARAIKFYLMAQTEAGHGCPLSMTYAAVAALRSTPALAEVWEPRLTSCVYEPALAPVVSKRGALCGMAMTEKQGGSDVRANTTRAIRDGDGYRLTGHKWFCSVPMSDAFLVLAQTGSGLSCFLLPRVLPDGTRNAFFIQRLKDKLGNRSNASSEVELVDAYAHLVGEEGRGVPTIAEMVNSTRLDCVTGSAATMRAALAAAGNHARHRAAFGKLLIDQPAMRNVLADLVLESEAATVLFARLARAVDEGDAPLRRLGTAIGKYWVCKRAPAFVGEALEVLGGNGYVEESALPRLYREAPLNSIWEGSGNINALDVLRIFDRQPDALEALRAEIGPSDEIERLVRNANETTARYVVERLALLWQAALLARFAPAAVSRGFAASRVAGEGGRAFGTLPAGTNFDAILERM